MPTHSGDMRVTFPRLPDHERAWALVERDDGVVYRLYGGTAGPRLPHDIMHLVVERELRIKDGIWAGVAAGVVFEHAAQRPPPAARGRAFPFPLRFRAACAPNSSPTWCPVPPPWIR